MAYVYRHIREDKNEPFYIGIGSDNGFYRAKATSKRSSIWQKVASKTPYRIEIMLCDLTYDEARQKEKEFIALYGRKNTNTGTLVNLTDGGEGNIGFVPTSDSIIKMKEASARRILTPELRAKFATNKNKIQSQETKDKIAKAHIGIKPNEATRKKLSDFHKTKTLSEEHKKSISDAMKGRKYSDETIKRMSIAASNRKIINGHWVKKTI